jgi:hypothetical protein
MVIFRRLKRRVVRRMVTIQEIVKNKKIAEGQIKQILSNLELDGIKIDGVLVAHDFQNGKMEEIENVEVKLAIMEDNV